MAPERGGDECRGERGAPWRGLHPSAALLSAALIWVTHACGGSTGWRLPGDPQPPSTFDRALERARAGDPDSQNLLGFMLFYGQAATADATSARYWFTQAARSGSAAAQINLSVIHALGVGVEADRVEAARFFRMALQNPDRPLALSFSSVEHTVAVACDPSLAPDTPGSRVFGVFCAGCHGVSGIAEYAAAPSFALGERLENDDDALMTSIEWGHQDMPQWSDKLPRAWLSDALAHIRALPEEFREGTIHRVRTLPPLAFRFGPMDPQLGGRGREPPVGIEGEPPPLERLCAAWAP